MLLILLDQIQYSSRERAIQVCWFYRDVWTLDWSQNIIDHTNIPEFVIADRRSDTRNWCLFESKN
jgi:hypothetical protein